MSPAATELDTWNVNQAVVAGVVSQYGVKTSTQDNGARRVGFSVQVQERGADARVHNIFLDIVAWGRAAEVAGTLKAGEAVVLEGRLVRTQRTRKGANAPEWYTTIQATKVQRLDTAPEQGDDA